MKPKEICEQSNSMNDNIYRKVCRAPISRAIWLVHCFRPAGDTGGDPVLGWFCPGWRGGGGKSDGYTGNALPSCGPINSRRNTIYAIVPHYEDERAC